MAESIRSSLKPLAVGVVMLTAFVAFSSPHGVVVSQDGEINGVANRLRAAAQGEAFWSDQVEEVEKAIGSLRSQLRLDDELASVMARQTRQFNRELEEAYRSQPDLRRLAPSRADLLREEADRIEAEEGRRMVNRQELLRLAELERILKIVEARAR